MLLYILAFRNQASLFILPFPLHFCVFLGIPHILWFVGGYGDLVEEAKKKPFTPSMILHHIVTVLTTAKIVVMTLACVHNNCVDHCLFSDVYSIHTMKTVFWNVVPCSLVDVNWCFRSACCFHYQGNCPDDTGYMVQHPRRQSSSYLSLWEPQIPFSVHTVLEYDYWHP
jgi:hypothetical protein